MPMKFTPEDIAQISKTTNKLLVDKKIKPKLKLGHSTKQILEGQTDGDPSLGKAKNFAVEGDKVISDFIDMPEIVHEAIQKGLYSDISAELDFSKELGSWFIKAVSLLGADLPAVKSLDDLKLYLSEIDSTDNEIKFTSPLINIIKDNKMDVEKRLAELEAELIKSKSQNETDKIKIMAFSEQQKESKFEVAKDAILKPYQEDVKQGTLPPAILSKLESELISQKADFSENLNVSPGLTREIAQSYTKLNKKETAGNEEDEETASFSDPSEEVQKEVYKVMASGNMDYLAASEVVFSANPKLAEKYNEWSHNSMHEVN